MTTVTQVGLEWISDKTLDNEAGVIDDIAIGTNGSSESFFATALANEVYRASNGDPNVTVTETNDEGTYTFELDVTGGTEVTAGKSIREIALFESNGTMICIGNFNPVFIESGQTETFRVEFNPDA